jgi:hypothetical protein
MDIISIEYFEYLLSIGCPYRGYVIGIGYVQSVPGVSKSDKSNYHCREFTVEHNRYIIEDSSSIYMIYVKRKPRAISKQNSWKSSREITPFELGVEWLTGKGPRHRDFTGGDLLTEMLKKHDHIENVRRKIKDDSQAGQIDSVEHRERYDLSSILGVGKYIKDYSTLLTFGLTGNLAVTYLGSYELYWKILSVDANKKTAVVEFRVENSSTMQSASRPPIIGYYPIWQNTIGKTINEAFETGPGSETTQTIKWEETIKF